MTTTGSASTTGEIDRVPLVTGSQIGDSGTGIHLVAGILAALLHREKSGRGQRVTVAMQDAVLNLCRVKLRDQQRLAHGPLKEYPQYPNGKFGAAVPRAGNASGGGHPGWIVKCKGWETDPDAYIYVITQAQAFPALAKVIGHADWLEDWRFLATSDRMHSDDFDGAFQGLHLPGTVVDKIYRRNAEALFVNAWHTTAESVE